MMVYTILYLLFVSLVYGNSFYSANVFIADQWTHISGNVTTDTRGVYSGIVYPGARSHAGFVMTNSRDIIYMFGGEGYDENGDFGNCGVNYLL